MSDLPTLAEEREREAIAKAHEVFKASRELMSAGMIQAAGYRVVVKPLPVIKGLEVAQIEAFPTLAQKDFEAKSDHQVKREELGENHGIVINMGATAFDRLGGRENWCDEGDVVIYHRYAGSLIEHPPGTGVMYRVLNDEDIAGKVV